MPLAGYKSIIMLGGTPISNVLDFRFEQDKEGKPDCVGLDQFYEAHCPPYKSMDEAVDAFSVDTWKCGMAPAKRSE